METTGRTFDEFVQGLPDDVDYERIQDFIHRLRTGREIIFKTLRYAITEFKFEMRVISESQFEIEFFDEDAPPNLLITIDSPAPETPPDDEGYDEEL
jgi:hypothetical protein